jgi:hypothetical protein
MAVLEKRYRCSHCAAIIWLGTPDYDWGTAYYCKCVICGRYDGKECVEAEFRMLEMANARNSDRED